MANKWNTTAVTVSTESVLHTVQIRQFYFKSFQQLQDSIKLPRPA